MAIETKQKPSADYADAFSGIGRICGFKSGRTQSSLTGSAVRGEALKDRSEGSWRSGRRRSGDVGGGGTVNDLVYSVSCRDLLSTRCARKPLPSVSHRYLAL
jgi:hypothetical protein